MPTSWKHPISTPPQVRSYILIAFNDMTSLLSLRKDLIAKFGPIEYETENFSAKTWRSNYNLYFNHIRLLSLKTLIKREEIVRFRKQTMTLESKYAKEGPPSIELDPGYLSQHLVVRTELQEDFHRIYLYDGIYAETIFKFIKSSFSPLEHTQEYFHNKEIINAFNDIRLIHLSD